MKVLKIGSVEINKNKDFVGCGCDYWDDSDYCGCDFGCPQYTRGATKI